MTYIFFILVNILDLDVPENTSRRYHLMNHELEFQPRIAMRFKRRQGRLDIKNIPSVLKYGAAGQKTNSPSPFR